MTGFILSHGWGLNPGFFDPLLPLLQDTPTLFWNRGYFGDPHMPQPKPLEGGWVGMGHSLGLSHLIRGNLPLRGLIGLNAFGCFLGQNPSLAEQRKPLLRAFHQSYLKSPLQLLNEFRQNCGLEMSPFEPNWGRLEEDLLILKKNIIDSWPSVPTLIIGCENDPIVPPDLLKDNFGTLSQVVVVILPNGGHGLGSLPEITTLIKDFMERL